MLKLIFSFSSFLAIAWSLIGSSGVYAQPVISSFQAGGAGSGTSQQEYIHLYNNSDTDIEVTNWCVMYGETTAVYCFVPPDNQTKLYFLAHGSFLIASPQFSAANTAISPDATYSAGFTTNIPGTNGSIKITDAATQVIDRLGWGVGAGEGVPGLAGNLTAGKVFQRLNGIAPSSLQDTNVNSADFIVANSPATFLTGGVYEQVVIVDVCANIDGVQTTIPDGMVSDGVGGCAVPDVCPNIDGIQATLPAGYIKNNSGECREDMCGNIDGLQETVPSGYTVHGGTAVCELIPLENATLIISELLPNPGSYDAGNEFVELYNPNNRPISLSGYVLQLGPGFTQNFTLPSDRLLQPSEYMVFSDTVTGLVLPNSSASLRLVSPAGTIVSESLAYSSPKDNESWAVIDGVWQYTDQPTKGQANKPSMTDEEVAVSVTGTILAPCAAGKYRNPETNRCRSVFSSDTELAPCSAGQARNAETNRCRSVIVAASATLTPCKPGQERNPETNRCRNISTSNSTLKPCADNEERNPTTNRCRKKSLSTIAANSVKDIEADQVATGSGWVLAAGAMAGFGGYGVWEWRSEIVNGMRRIRGLLGKNPFGD